MKTNYKFTDTQPNDTLRAYAQTKVDAFEKLLGLQEAKAAICAVEFKRSTKHQTGKICTAEVNLEADGKLYRVTKDEPTFEKAIDKVKDDILRSLRSEKEKTIEAVRKGASEIKRKIQQN
ncbi:TPA: hypothetical protein DEP58_02635 [Patescibacteria group bacterium]|nr:MAG: hypothetical protein UU98_C0011G0004 [Parcubacteria group bacterium GW2011_GWD2_42_14]HCC05179.1 hypothetical protein [Patescibacteria group bacterium]